MYNPTHSMGSLRVPVIILAGITIAVVAASNIFIGRIIQRVEDAEGLQGIQRTPARVDAPAESTAITFRSGSAETAAQMHDGGAEKVTPISDDKIIHEPSISDIILVQ